jgi:phage baseplate assembly protein W
MAIKDTGRKPYIEDNDTNVSIGIDLPIRKSENKDGFFASTKTTIEAVKNNIRNLLQTNQGERLFQPTLGINLRNFLFNQIDDETIFSIQNEILDKLEYWLPFVEVRDIEVKTTDEDSTVNSNTIVLNIIFNIKQDPDTLASVQVDINNQTETNNTISDNIGGEY